MFTPLARTTALLAAGLLAAAASAGEPNPAPPLVPMKTAAQPKMVLVPYQVAELVVPIAKKGEPGKTCEDRLIRTVQDTISPRTWASHGGSGTIDYFPMTMTLIVNQTPDVQEQIADLLSRLRREQDTEVALEVRLVSMPDESFERVGVNFNVSADPAQGQCPAKACGQAAADGVQGAAEPKALLSEAQVHKFLEWTQGDQRTNVMQAPKLTVFNGQMANLDCTDRQKFVTGLVIVQRDGHPIPTPKTEEVVTGFRMSACPVVSADRRFVQVSLDITQADLASPAVPLCPVTVEIKDDQGNPRPFTQFLQQPKVNSLRIRNSVMVPDGGTILLGGVKKVVEGRVEYGPPVLSKVPYMHRLFRNVGYGRETHTVYVLVTPRVIVNEEKVQQATAPPCTAAPCWTVAPKACAAEYPANGTLRALGAPSCCTATTKACGTEECETVSAPSHGQSKALAELLKAYDEACAAGHTREAAKLAEAALVLDPTCFARPRGK